MKRLILLGLVIFLATANPAWAEEAPQAVKDLANAELAAIGGDPVIVAAVKEQNAKGMSLAEIQAMDTKWQETAGVADFMDALMNNPCAVRLKEIMNSKPFYAEIFVMDNQGANVCQTNKTSDYWQGDEGKFKNSYGANAVFVDEVEFDDSAQAYLTQVSVPVKDGGNVIGAITFGIDVDKVE